MVLVKWLIHATIIINHWLSLQSINTMQLIEPISRKLIRLGKLYLSVLTKQTAHLDVTRYHYILSLIYFHDGQLTQNALAQLLGKDKSAIVSIINMLTAKGFVYRDNNPLDRRQHLLKVTDKAKLAVPQVLETFESLNNDITKGISEEDLQAFERVLQQMRNNINPLTAA